MSRAPDVPRPSAGRPADDRSPRREAGRITILALGFATLALTLVVVVVDATAVHLDRKRLWNLADAAALAAADAVPVEKVHTGGLDVAREDPLPLTDGTVREAVEEYLASHGRAARGLSELGVERAGAPGGGAASVTLRARAHLPIANELLRPFGGGILLRASATATTGRVPGVAVVDPGGISPGVDAGSGP